MKRTFILAAAILVLSGGVAQAQTVFPVAGIQSWDAIGSGFNEVHPVNVSPDQFLNSVAWTAVTGFSIGPSWGLEARVYVDATSQPGGGVLQFFSVQVCPSSSPCGPSTGTVDTVSNSSIFPMALDPDGMIRLEFFESFDDTASAVDFSFTGGDLTFTTVIPVELMSFTVN